MNQKIVDALEGYLRARVSEYRVAADGTYSTGSGSKYRVTTRGDRHTVGRFGGAASSYEPSAAETLSGMALIVVMSDGTRLLAVLDPNSMKPLITTSPLV